MIKCRQFWLIIQTNYYSNIVKKANILAKITPIYSFSLYFNGILISFFCQILRKFILYILTYIEIVFVNKVKFSFSNTSLRYSLDFFYISFAKCKLKILQSTVDTFSEELKQTMPVQLQRFWTNEFRNVQNRLRDGVLIF